MLKRLIKGVFKGVFKVAKVGVIGGTILGGPSIYRKYIRKEHDFAERYGAKSWVVVTGASDGIGADFANQFASRGFNVVLVARNQERLDSAAQRIMKEHNVDVKTISADFSDSPIQKCQMVADATADLDVSVLINNVGMMREGMSVHEQDQNEIMAMINVNVITQTMLTKKFADRLYNRKKRSAIIDLSSMAGHGPTPKVNMYASTKKYNFNFSLSVGEDLKEKVDVLTVCPGLVKTPMTVNFWNEPGIVAPEACTKGALKSLGHERWTFGAAVHGMIYPFLSMPYDWSFKARENFEAKKNS